MVERTSKFWFVVVGSVLFMLILYQYVAPGMMNLGGSPHGYVVEDEADIYPSPDPHYVKKYYFPVRDLERTADFQIKGDDVIVFLHIQKTGGTTFGRHLVQNVRLEVPCDCRPGQKKCTCYRPNRKETWLFSRFSTGWSCGLHADWTELTNCVPGVLNKKKESKAKSQSRQGSSPLETAAAAWLFPSSSCPTCQAFRNPVNRIRSENYGTTAECLEGTLGAVPGETYQSSGKPAQVPPSLPAIQVLEHPHTVPADGAVGVEVEGHQAFWTCDDKPFILVPTTVPPHTDSLGVSTKTKAGLVTEDDPPPF
ncbi:hypothetical protein NFI96_005521 [Prochilodus magdalenae]|nr:hypothetical protein NFI96_005521 [Prochilodus magdalenae]